MCKAIFGHWSCHDKNRLGRADRNNVHVHCLLGLKNMTTYERVKPATAGPVANINKLKMICLFYFVLESEKIAIMLGLQWYLKNYAIFPLFIFFFISIPNVNSNRFLD